ncbi:MAG TPA: hypothetical protein ENO30_02840, partial [Thermodesulfobium narugense]|nr:hypothetical protein [Thermodesulfobium narugense]
MLEKLAEELRKKAKGIKESNFISKETLEKLSNYKPILKIEDQETGEIKEVKHFISRYAKEIMENFYVIEAKSEHKDTGLKAGIKISKATHHSLANIPVSTKAIKDNFRSSKMLFYPAKEIIHEVEITGISEEETSKFKTIRIIRLYYNRIKKLPITAKIIQAKITPNEIQTISHHEDIINNPEKLAKFCKENANRKTIIYKEELINDFSTLKDSLAKISKEEIVIINEEGEEENYKVEKTRPVGKLIFGMAYDKELKEFPAILPINIFTRKDIIEKKESIKFPESHKYITNEKSLKVNYDNMFLKSIDFSHPVLISHATATNQ